MSTPNSVESLKKTIVMLMSDCEIKQGSEFHELYPELDREIWHAMESKNVPRLSGIIRILKKMC